MPHAPQERENGSEKKAEREREYTKMSRPPQRRKNKQKREIKSKNKPQKGIKLERKNVEHKKARHCPSSKKKNKSPKHRL